MMSKSDDDGVTHARSRREQLLDQLTARLNQFIEANGARSTPSDDHYDSLAGAILTCEVYYRQWLDESDSAGDDDDGGGALAANPTQEALSTLRDRANELRRLQRQVVVNEVDAPGLSSGKNREPMPALYEQDPEWLAETAELVLRVNHQLGFGEDEQSGTTTYPDPV